MPSASPSSRGRPPPVRATACRRARAADLKTASAAWWPFRARKHVDVEVELAAERRGLPELLDERERELLRDEEELLVDRRLEDDVRAPREVDDRARQRLVERDVARPEALDTGPVAERLGPAPRRTPARRPPRCGARRCACRPSPGPRGRSARASRPSRACARGTRPASRSRPRPSRRRRATGRPTSPSSSARTSRCGSSRLLQAGDPRQLGQEEVVLRREARSSPAAGPARRGRGPGRGRPGGGAPSAPARPRRPAARRRRSSPRPARLSPPSPGAPRRRAPAPPRWRATRSRADPASSRRATASSSAAWSTLNGRTAFPISRRELRRRDGVADPEAGRRERLREGPEDDDVPPLVDERQGARPSGAKST